MKSFTRNSATSIFTTGLDFAVLTGLVEVFHVNYVLATFLGTVVGAGSNFIINRHWSFEATHSLKRWQLVRFLPVQIGSSSLTTLGVWLFTANTRLAYYQSKVVVAVMVYLIWNYPMNRWFVFRRFSRAAPGETSRSSPPAG